VTGGAGFVGRQTAIEFRKTDADVGVTVHDHDPRLDDVASFELDVCNAERTEEVITTFDPDLTIHAAALTDADKCEKHPDLAHRVNVDGTDNVVAACETVNSRVVFLSSSFVFSGQKDHYTEHDQRAPINVYGETKATGEDIVLSSSDANTVVRIDQPYGWAKDWQPETMVTWTLDKLASNERVPVFSDWHNSPIYNLDLARALRHIGDREFTGIYHTVGPDFISRYDWAVLIAEIFGYDKDRIDRSTSSKADLPAERPNAHLSPTKLRRDTGTCPRSVQDGLREMSGSVDTSQW
jgi:dTDP-4-dehydrorhamnose reductase